MKIIRDHNKTFPYIAYIPDEISENPAVIFQLHGAGERGYGNENLDKVLIHGLPNIVNDDNLKDCILVMPQCPSNTFWVAKIESLGKFFDEIFEEYNVDKTRVYLCGLSMGGYGTWYTAMAYPQLFTAIAPCCGGGMAWNAGMLKMPIWAFHGKDDTVVLPENTLEMARKLESVNPNFKYTIYENTGHNSWSKAFSEELLKWFFSIRKK